MVSPADVCMWMENERKAYQVVTALLSLGPWWPQKCRRCGPDPPLLQGAALCAGRCLLASWPSLHQIPKAPLLPVMTTKTVLRQYQTSLGSVGGAQLPRWGPPVLRPLGAFSLNLYRIKLLPFFLNVFWKQVTGLQIWPSLKKTFFHCFIKKLFYCCFNSILSICLFELSAIDTTFHYHNTCDALGLQDIRYCLLSFRRLLEAADTGLNNLTSKPSHLKNFLKPE